MIYYDVLLICKYRKPILFQFSLIARTPSILSTLFCYFVRTVRMVCLWRVLIDVRVGRIGLRDGGSYGDDAVLRGAAAQGAGRQQRRGGGAAHFARGDIAVRGAEPCGEVVHFCFQGVCVRTAVCLAMLRYMCGANDTGKCARTKFCV